MLYWCYTSVGPTVQSEQRISSSFAQDAQQLSASQVFDFLWLDEIQYANQKILGKWHIRKVVWVVGSINELQLRLRILHGNACHLATNAAEAVDSNTNCLHRSAVPSGTLANSTSSHQAGHSSNSCHGSHGLRRLGSLRVACRSQVSLGLGHRCGGHEGTAQGTARQGAAAKQSHVLHRGRHGDRIEILIKSASPSQENRCARNVENKDQDVQVFWTSFGICLVALLSKNPQQLTKSSLWSVNSSPEANTLVL